MNPSSQLAFAFVGHVVGDYIWQNDWMALNKKKKTWPCMIHCAMWTTAVLLFAGHSWWRWWTPFLLFGLHFMQDRTTLIEWWMRMNGQKGFLKAMAPWSSIIVDNSWHMVQLAIVAKLLSVTDWYKWSFSPLKPFDLLIMTMGLIVLSYFWGWACDVLHKTNYGYMDVWEAMAEVKKEENQ